MITAHGVTHPGRVGTANEDTVLIDDNLGLYAVADGMGGRNAGDVASMLAVETMRVFMDRSRNANECTWPFGVDGRVSLDANRLLTVVKLANRRVFRAADSNDDYTEMGTTVAAALVLGDRLVLEVASPQRESSFTVEVAEAPNAVPLTDRSRLSNLLLLDMEETLARADTPLAEEAARLNLAVAHLRISNWDLAPGRSPRVGGDVSYLTSLYLIEISQLTAAEEALRRAVAAEESRLFIGGPPVPSLARQGLDELLSR